MVGIRFAFVYTWSKDGLDWTGGGKVLSGWALAQLGEGDENLAQVESGLAMWRATGAGLVVPYFLGLLAETHRSLGQIEAAQASVAEAKALLKRSDERWFEAELHRLEGELLLDRKRKKYKQAETCFERALEVARAQQTKSLELRAAISLSRLWQNKGRCDEARSLLGSIYQWFTEGFDTVDLREAKSLLEEL